MKQMDILIRGEKLREQVAYWRIANGMSIKEISGILGLTEKAVEWHWNCVRRIIQGRPMRTGGVC